MHFKTMVFNLLSATVFAATAFGVNASAAEKFELTGNLKPGQSIPADYYANVFGCSAKNMSPALEWKNVPEGTRSFAVTVYDESAPTGSGFWHYVLIDIPANVHKIDLGDLSQAKIPQGSVEMMTDAGKPGYFGPCPPIGRKHTYLFTVYALKVEKLGVPISSTPGFVGFNLWANSLGKASFKVTAGPRK
ncbi:MAG: YbhB/YbcL family Raf kinase inhibitor-like protein [Deltaproteobacteria bacterium]|nr:YbhB/YbcL family Raf kinase inhibitor-like protein [Deltaproteobacteria bacterium]